MRYLIAILCVVSFWGCQRTPEMKWYNRVLDSLGRIEAPLTIDTALFNRQMAGRQGLDTIINNMVIYQSRYYHKYSIYSHHKDSLITNNYEYDGDDGKLISWSRYFVNSNGALVDYTKWYKKNGKIENFGAGETGYEPSPMPNFTIYRLIERLRRENIDLMNDVYIGRIPADTVKIHFGEISYWKYNWEVKVSYWYDHHRDYASIHCREFDSDTGGFVKEWWESWGIE